MTLEQLRVFVAVAERQHMTQAAEAINITQSAASAAIASLESRHAVKLFNRVGRRIELTAAGQMFFGEARAVLARAAAAERSLADLAGLKRGTLSLYASQTIVNYWLPTRVAEFRKLYPDVQMTVKAANTEQVVAATRDGIADLGLVEGSVDEPQLECREIGSDKVIVVLPRGYALAGKKKLSASVLKGADWVVREPGSGTRAVFEAALARAGLSFADLNVVLELPSNEAVCAAVASGVGGTAVSALVAQAGLRAGTLIAPEFPLPERPFLLLRHKERYISAAEAAFLDVAGDTGRVGRLRRGSRTS